MSKYADIIKNITEIEYSSGVYDIRIHGFRFWRIVRAPVIDRYIKNNYDKNSRDTAKKPLYLLQFLKSYMYSMWAFMSLFVSKKRNGYFVVFAFPRLQKVNKVFVDKFTDPLINNSALIDNCTIFQRSLSGLHKKPRLNNKNIYTTDFFDFTARFTGFALMPLVFLIWGKKLYKIYRRALPHFNLGIKDFLAFNYSLGVFLSSYFFYKLLFRLVKPPKVLLVNRGINYAAIHACKKRGIKTYEIQHGITHSYTVLYSGKYDQMIDPDFFLAFGPFWKGKQFGLQVDKIINIGWAYKDYLKEINSKEKKPENTILVISEPIASDYIINAVKALAAKYINVKFDLRLHPQERFSELQQQAVLEYKNITRVENTTESSLAVMAYQKVIGQNSSVLYEALGIGKRVGCINFAGCHTFADSKTLKDYFTIINSVEDFQDFLLLPQEKVNENKTYYSPYNPEFFNNILNEKDF